MMYGCTVQGGDSGGVEILGTDSSFVAAHTKVGLTCLIIILLKISYDDYNNDDNDNNDYDNNDYNNDDYNNDDYNNDD